MTTRPSFFAAAAWIVAPQIKLYACCGCHGDFRLNALNDDMMCEDCGPAVEDEDDFIDTSYEEMKREHGFYA